MDAPKHNHCYALVPFLAHASFLIPQPPLGNQMIECTREGGVGNVLTSADAPSIISAAAACLRGPSEENADSDSSPVERSNEDCSSSTSSFGGFWTGEYCAQDASLLLCMALETRRWLLATGKQSLSLPTIIMCLEHAQRQHARRVWRVGSTEEAHILCAVLQSRKSPEGPRDAATFRRAFTVRYTLLRPG